MLMKLTPGPYIRRINNDAREDEMEDNMQAVGSVLSNLKNMAQDMGNEISKQNKQLDRITNKVSLLCLFDPDPDATCLLLFLLPLCLHFYVLVIHWGLVIGTVQLTRPSLPDSLLVQNLSLHTLLSIHCTDDKAWAISLYW